MARNGHPPMPAVGCYWAQRDPARIGQNRRAAESTVFFSHSWASLPRGHTGPGRGYLGGSLDRRTLSRETAISRRSWCRTSAWRQSPVPKPQAISHLQSPRREILSSSCSSPRPIYLLASFIRHSSHAVCPGPTIRGYRTTAALVRLLDLLAKRRFTNVQWGLASRRATSPCREHQPDFCSSRLLTNRP